MGQKLEQWVEWLSLVKIEQQNFLMLRKWTDGQEKHRPLLVSLTLESGI